MQFEILAESVLLKIVKNYVDFMNSIAKFSRKRPIEVMKSNNLVLDI